MTGRNCNRKRNIFSGDGNITAFGGRITTQAHPPIGKEKRSWLVCGEEIAVHSLKSLTVKF